MTFAKRINTSISAAFMKCLKDATAQLYGYLVVDLKASTSDQDRLQTIIFESTNQRIPDEGNVFDDDDSSSMESLDYIQRKFRDERSKSNIWNRKFLNPLRQGNIEQFKVKVNDYKEQCFT